MLKIKKQHKFDTKIASKILKELDSIFKELNIKYLLVGGTLLGCIRHGHLMEWDDDLDLLLLDQAAFLNICNKKIFEKRNFETKISYFNKKNLKYFFQIYKDTIQTDLWPSQIAPEEGVIKTHMGDYLIEKTFPEHIVEFEGHKYPIPKDPYYYLDKNIGNENWRYKIIKRSDQKYNSAIEPENFYGPLHYPSLS